MTRKLGRAGECICFGFALIMALLMTVRTVMTAVEEGELGLLTLAGFVLSGAFVWLAYRLSRPMKAYPLLLFCLRLSLALAVIFTVQSQPTQDFKTLYNAACQMAQGSREYLNEAYFYNWAYQTGFVAYEALVIRIFGQSLLPLKLLNAMWMAGTGVLVFVIGKCLFSERTAMVASLFYAVYPAPYFLASVLTNQHIAAFFYYFAIWLLLRKKQLTWQNALPAGLALAIGNVMRPLGSVIVLAILCWGAIRLLKQGKGYLQEGAAVLACIAVYFAVSRLCSHLIIWTGLNPEGLKNNLSIWKFVVGFNAESGGVWNTADYAYYQLPHDEALTAMKELVAERLRQPLGDWIDLLWEKIRVLWGSCEDLNWAVSHWDKKKIIFGHSIEMWLKAVKFADRGVFLFAIALNLPGLLRALRQKDSSKAALLLGFLFCGYTAVHLLIEVQARYRYFLMPVILLFAGVGVEQLACMARKIKGNDL